MQAPSGAAILKIFDLYDGYTTNMSRLMLKGQARGADEVTVNGQKVDLGDDGIFRTGLVVARGKNLVVVRARWGEGEQKRVIRLLRLASFPDVEILYAGQPHWARKDILNLATLGMIEGYPDGSFEPKKDISRGEVATWLVRAQGDRAEKPLADPFFDVPKEHWRAPYISTAVRNGYMSGISKDIFGIDDPMKREDVVAVIDRAKRLKDSEAAARIFQDVPKNTPSSLKIYRAYKAGLVIGVLARKIFQPERMMRRDEMAKVLARFPNIKVKVRELADFSRGYDEGRLCRINTEPVLPWAKAMPHDIPRDGQTPLTLSAKVSDRQGQSDISLVRVDLRPLGGPPDAVMYDDATGGDQKAGDGIYTLQVLVYEDTEAGVKRLRIVAMDKSGWEGEKWVEILVLKQW